MVFTSDRACLGHRHLFSCLCFFVLVAVFSTRLSLQDTLSFIANSTDNSSQLANQHGRIIYSVADCGSLVLPLPVGVFAQRYGGRYLVLGTLLVSSILNALTPLVVHMSFWGMVSLRALLGTVQSIVTPAMAVMLSRWIPPTEISACLTLITSGGVVGVTLSRLLSLYLPSTSLGWLSVFYFTSAFAFALFPIWLFIASEAPKDSSRIQDPELRYLRLHIEERPHRLPTGVPWGPLLSDISVWTIVLLSMTAGATFSVIYRCLPYYLHLITKMSTTEEYVVFSLPTLAGIVFGMITASVTDMLINRMVFPATCLRKFLALISTSGTAVCLIMTTHVDDKPSIVLPLLFGAVISASLLGSSLLPNVFEIAPEQSGIITGLSFTAATAGALVAPIVNLNVVMDGSDGDWEGAMYIWGAVAASGGVAFLLFGSSKRRNWLADAAVAPPRRRPSLPTVAPISVYHDTRRHSLIEDANWSVQ